MLLAVHAAVGAIAGNAVGNPIAAFAVGVVSHFFTDMIPHGDWHMYEDYKRGHKVASAMWKVAVDAVATIVLIAIFFIFQDFFHPLNVALGIAGGLLPDLIVGIVEITKPKRRSWLNRQLTRFHGFHMKNHTVILKFRGNKDIPYHHGLILQGILLFGLIKVIL